MCLSGTVEVANSHNRSETVPLSTSESQKLVASAGAAKVPSASSLPSKSATPSEIQSLDNGGVAESIDCFFLNSPNAYCFFYAISRLIVLVDNEKFRITILFMQQGLELHS